LKSLTSLKLCHILLSDSVIDSLKRLHSLRILNINEGEWSESHLARLAKPPLRMPHLTDLVISSPVSIGQLQTLLKIFPDLASLMNAPLLLESLPTLQTIQSFTALKVKLADVDGIAPAALFLQPLCACKLLTEAQFHETSFTLIELEQLAQSLSLLTDLTFVQSQLPSLSPLSIFSKLHTLEFQQCPGMRAEHLLHLASVKSLRVLRADLQDDEACLAKLMLASPSKLPQITEFDIKTSEG
jgi:hypothetical protein